MHGVVAVDHHPLGQDICHPAAAGFQCDLNLRFAPTTAANAHNFANEVSRRLNLQ
jgi:hypothetical protein